MANIVFLCIGIYVAASLLLPWRVKARYRIPAAVFVLLVSQYFNLMHLCFGGGFFTPEGPRFLLLPGTWCFVVLLEMFVLLMFRDVCRLVYALIFRHNAEMRKKFPVNATSLGLLLAAAILALCGMVSALSVPEVKRFEVELPRLPAELDGFSIAVVADMHASALAGRDFVERVVERTLAAKPDMIVFPGDMADGPLALRKDAVEPLQKLSAPCGVFAVPGNHEHYSGIDEWLAHYRETGFPVLENESRRIERNGGTLFVAGVGDKAFYRGALPGHPPAGGFPPDAEKAFAGIDRNFPVVVLSHRPETADEFAGRGADLQISGHTHGGQMLIFDRVFVAPANRGRVRGLYQVGDMRLYVSPGAGLWSGFPVRLGVPPEITLLVLRSPAQK